MQKLLTMYTPASDFEERVPVEVIRRVVHKKQTKISSEGSDNLMFNVKHRFPVSFPYSPVEVDFASVSLPHQLKCAIRI